jgi:hypothetical protein
MEHRLRPRQLGLVIGVVLVAAAGMLLAPVISDWWREDTCTPLREGTSSHVSLSLVPAGVKCRYELRRARSVVEVQTYWEPAGWLVPGMAGAGLLAFLVGGSASLLKRE